MTGFCGHTYAGKMRGVEKYKPRQATIYRETDGQPDKKVGQGCWTVDELNQKFEYIGYEGYFNSDKEGKIINVPWPDMFNANKAG